MTDIALDEKALLPCPHCGEGLVEHTDHHGSWWAHRNEPADCAHGVTQLFDAEDIEQWNRRASPSQVAPQPQAGEPVTMQYRYRHRNPKAIWSEWGDHKAALSSYSDWEEEGRPLYASPQPANPVQMTDAREALIERYASACKRNSAEMATMPLSVVLQHFREFADEIAAIGAGGQAVAVKALEWNENDAPSPVGGYRVQRLDDKWEPLRGGYYMLPRRHGVVEAFETIEAAKAAAQADYERRILSALSQPHPADERVVEALREAYWYCRELLDKAGFTQRPDGSFSKTTVIPAGRQELTDNGRGE